MAGFVLVSAKGAPGVTTVAAAVAAVAAADGPSLLAELDPSGGSVQVAAESSLRSGLVEAAGALRRDPRQVDAVLSNVIDLPPGVASLVAPTMGQSAESVIRSVGPRWMPVLGASAPVVMVDGGRWAPTQGSAARVTGAGLVVLVSAPTLHGVEHTRHLVQPLREASRQQVALVVVGQRPYGPDEVARHLGVPLAGALAWDPSGADMLWSSGCSRRWLRTRLGRSAGLVLDGLLDLRAARVSRTGAPGQEAEPPALAASPSASVPPPPPREAPSPPVPAPPAPAPAPAPAGRPAEKPSRSSRRPKPVPPAEVPPPRPGSGPRRDIPEPEHKPEPMASPPDRSEPEPESSPPAVQDVDEPRPAPPPPPGERGHRADSSFSAMAMFLGTAMAPVLGAGG